MSQIYAFSARTIDGLEQSLADYRGKVLLLVNVASACGLTPQYQGLEALYRSYHSQGFSVLGFPCNQFGAQEKGTEAEIKEFCSRQFAVSFPLFAKIDVNGPSAHPLYQWLKAAQAGSTGERDIEWNFAKFLIDRDGNCVRRFHPRTEPQEVEPEIVALLAKRASLQG